MCSIVKQFQMKQKITLLLMIHELKETILSFGYDRSIMAKHEGERLSFPNEFFEAAQTVIG